MFKIHYKLIAKQNPYLLGVVWLSIAAMARWYPHSLTGFRAHMTLAMLLIVTPLIWKRYYNVLLGKPGFVLSADGLWDELTKRQVDWEIISISHYQNPDILVIHYPFRPPRFVLALQSILPKSIFRQQTEVLLGQIRIQESILYVISEFKRYKTIETRGNASRGLIRELKS